MYCKFKASLIFNLLWHFCAACRLKKNVIISMKSSSMAALEIIILTFIQTLMTILSKWWHFCSLHYPGPYITKLIWHLNSFSQWQHSFQWKLCCHWLEVLPQHYTGIVIQGPVVLHCVITGANCIIYSLHDQSKSNHGYVLQKLPESILY